jgi:protein-disulfide isomerase
MRCPKCGYLRKAQEAAPEWQCPSCGVAYAKVASVAAGDRPAGASAAGGSGARKFGVFILVLVAIGVGTVVSAVMRADPKVTLKEYAQSRIVMYSLTTCGYCNMKRAELKSHDIPFVEYFIDKDPARQRELFDKLAAAGYRGRAVGTPTFEVNGRMLPNNPSLATIRKHL